MKITNNTNYRNNTSFKSWMTNKHVLNGLEHIADHATTFVAATSFIMAAGVRPAIIAATPDVDKENKQYSITNSIASGIIKFGLVEAVALPVEAAIKKIDKTPEKFLTKETVQNLQGSAKNLAESKNYNIMTQMIKLGTNLVTSVPKAMLTIALIPPIMSFMFPKKNEKSRYDNFLKRENPPIYNSIAPKGDVSFKGAFSDVVTKGTAGIINNKTLQNILVKHNFNENNIARNMSIATDLALTASFVHRTSKSKKIKEERKKPLIYNNVISTGISLLAGYGIDKAVQKNTKNFIKKFAEQNKGNPKLEKYIQGINIVRPTMIFAGIYYGILPLFSTYIADKTDKLVKGVKENKTTSD